MKNKFKIIIMLFVVVFMWQILGGCQSTQKGPEGVLYNTNILDISSNSLVTLDSQIVDNPWPNPQSPEDQQNTKFCEFMGKSYTGEYRDSWAFSHTPMIIDDYKTSEGYYFSLDRKTGKLILMDFKNNVFWDTEPLLKDVENPEETAINIATDIANKYIQLSDYERTVDLERYFDGTERAFIIYKVAFTKHVQGYATSDELVVRVTSKGNFTSIRWGCFGGFDDIPFEIDKQRVEDEALAKAKEIYADTAYTIMGVEIAQQILARTQKEELCILSSVILELKDSAGEAYRTGVSVVTYLQYE